MVMCLEAMLEVGEVWPSTTAAPSGGPTSEFAIAQLSALMTSSSGCDGWQWLQPGMRQWADGLRSQLPTRFFVHVDGAAAEAARMFGAAAFVWRDRLYLGDVPNQLLDQVVRHELVHLAQVQLALRTGDVRTSAMVEYEAEQLSHERAPTLVRCGADPSRVHPIVWFVAGAVGLYILLRPKVANAPAQADSTRRSPSDAQIVAEAMCIFAVPAGAMALGTRLGLGFLGSAALSGAIATPSLRVVEDVAEKKLSPPLMYVFDAATGAAIGYIVPGGIRLIGQAGTHALDRLATYGLRSSDFAITKMLAEQAAKAPLTAVEAQKFLRARGVVGQVSRWWMDRRNVILLYRGQEVSTRSILSPLAREQGVAASEELVDRLRSFGASYEEIAGYTARWYTQPVPPFFAPPGLAGLPLGAVGIPTTRIPGIAAGFGDGVIYVIRVPKPLAVSPIGWQGLQLENEYVILNQVPPGAIVQAIPSSEVAPLMVDANGRLVPGL